MTLERPTKTQIATAIRDSESAAPGGPRPPFLGGEIITLREIHDVPREYDTVVSGIVNAGEGAVFSAGGGVGKSTLVEQFAFEIAAAGPDRPPLLGRFRIPTPRSILLIQSENSRVTLHKRITRKCAGDPALSRGLDNIFILGSADDETCLFGAHFNDELFRAHLLEKIAEIQRKFRKKIEILIIDPFISFSGAEDENRNSEIREILDLVTSICRQAEVTPIIVHHAGKSGEIRGASAIVDWARCHIHLTRAKNGKDVRIECLKNNNNPRFEPFDIRLDPQTMLFFPVDAETYISERDRESIENCRRVYLLLQRLGGEIKSQNRLGEAYAELHSVSKKTGNRHVAVALEKKYIEPVFGPGKDGDPKLTGYKLSPAENPRTWR
jgi:hypothetical protein